MSEFCWQPDEGPPLFNWAKIVGQGERWWNWQGTALAIPGMDVGYRGRALVFLIDRHGQPLHQFALDLGAQALDLAEIEHRPDEMLQAAWSHIAWQSPEDFIRETPLGVGLARRWVGDDD